MCRPVIDSHDVGTETALPRRLDIQFPRDLGDRAGAVERSVTIRSGSDMKPAFLQKPAEHRPGQLLQIADTCMVQEASRRGLPEEARHAQAGIAPQRPDYALSWIHNYGKGRVFFCALGHRPTLCEVC